MTVGQVAAEVQEHGWCAAGGESDIVHFASHVSLRIPRLRNYFRPHK